MSKIIVLQHAAWEILGTLNILLKEAGHRIKYVNFARDPLYKVSLEGYDSLVLLGGPMNVDEEKKYPHLTHEIHLIEEALKKKIPTLGICLGAQLIAKTLGATVRKNPAKEIGWHPITLTDNGKKSPYFEGYAETETLFHWHGDTFDIPAGATHLALSPLCNNQAFSYGENTLALQFHLEVDKTMIKRWLHVPSMREEFLACHPEKDEVSFLIESKQYLPPLQSMSQKTFGSFIQKIGTPKKTKITLPSR